MKTKYFTVPNSVQYNYTTGLDVEHNTAAEIKQQLARDGYIFFITKNGTELADSARTGTGSIINYIRPEAGFVSVISTAVIFGDVNGDGIINQNDKGTIRDEIEYNSNALTAGSAYYEAADMNGDGAVDAFDLFYCDGMATGERDFDQSRVID